MKFLIWLFNINARHSWDIRRYEKGKIGTKIFTIIFLLALVGVTLGIEYWCINLFKANPLQGILVLILLLLPIAAVTFESCELYCYLGFKMFFWGTVGSIIEKIDKKRRQKQIENGDIEIIETEVENTPKQKNSEKARKWIDLFIGILSLLLGIGTLAGIIVLIAVANN